MKKFLISGGSGFIGNYFINNFSDKKNIYFILLKNSKKNKKLQKSLKKKNFKFLFFKKNSEIYTLISKKKINFFIDFSTYFNTKNNFKIAERIIKSNILFPILVLEAINKKYLKKVINFSSMSQHQQNKKYLPLNLYSASKEANEKLLIFYKISLKNTKFFNIKLYETYDENDKRNKLIPTILKNYKNNLVTNIKSNKLLLNFLHVSDICQAVILLINKKINSGQYQIKAKESVNIKKIIDKFNKNNVKKIKYNILGNKHFNVNYKLKKLPFWKQTRNINTDFNFLLNKDYKYKI